MSSVESDADFFKPTITIITRPSTKFNPVTSDYPSLPNNISLINCSHTTLPGQLISNVDTPSENDWAFHPLYSQSQVASKSRFWQIGYNSLYQCLVTIYGFIDGKQMESPIYHRIEAKAGKTLLEQALQEARIRYLNKYREGARPAGEVNYDIKPQKANHYNIPGDLKDNGKAKPVNCKHFPVIIQGKIDGNRATLNLKGDHVNVLSLNLIDFAWLEPQRAEIKVFFSYLPEGTRIDTELYRHGWNHEYINSVLQTKLHCHPHNHLIKIYIFDIIEPNNLPVEKRFSILIKAYQQYLADGNKDNYFTILAPTIAYSHQDIWDIHHYFTTQLDMEGIMIRKIAGKSTNTKIKESATYRGKRNNNLLKFKKWKYDEGVIIQVYPVIEQNKYVAMFVIQNSKQRVFPVRPKGTFELRQYWLQNPNVCVGQLYTYKYFEETAYGEPRFPIGECFRINT